MWPHNLQLILSVAPYVFVFTAGSKVNAADFERGTALHVASEEGNTECVRVLVKAGAKPNEKRRSGATPLIMAAKRGQLYRQ